MKRVLFIAAVLAAAAGGVCASQAISASVPTCPGHAPTLVSRGVPTRRFVRPGATEMLLCRYYGVNWADPKGLMKQRLMRGSLTIGRITRTLNRLRKPPRGIFCARDDGSELLVAFVYPGGRVERVAVKLTGCRFAMNGRSTRWSTPRLQRRLLNLVKSR